MLEQYTKTHYQKYCIDPVINKIQHITTPNQVTILAGITGLISAIAVFYNAIFFGILFLLLSGYADTLDGSLARVQGSSSSFGTLLDILTDRFVEFIIIFALYLQDPFTRGTVSLLMLGSVLLCVTSFLVVGIFTENQSSKGFHYSPGLMERVEAFILFILMIALPTYFYYLALLFSILVILTAVIRVREFYFYQYK